jgi:DNA ligase D-like protein (predicted ligase)
MLLLRTSKLPAADSWLRELKFDGYRAIAFKTDNTLHLRSRRNKDFTTRFPEVAKALQSLPDNTVVDGEIVALDQKGRPSFNLLQNYKSSRNPLVFYIFDLLILSGRNVMDRTLGERRDLLERKVLPKLDEPVRYSPELISPPPDLIKAIKAQGFEGVVAKDRNSLYQPGLRTGAWRKMRINSGQEFVIGGYTVGGSTFDALIFGYYKGNQLMFASRTRSGFTPASRRELRRRFKGLETTTCPFANLPESRSGRWGQGLTGAKMKDCRWLKPVLVGQFEFTEWTPDGHLRHSKFLALRDDKKARNVRRE